MNMNGMLFWTIEFETIIIILAIIIKYLNQNSFVYFEFMNFYEFDTVSLCIVFFFLGFARFSGLVAIIADIRLLLGY